MSSKGLSNRRELVATIAGGALLGAIWGAAFPIVASEQRPSFAIVGRQGSQLALIDSGNGRALLCIGEPDETLISQLPAMMTIFRQRIDIIIGTEAMLGKQARSLAERWRISHAIVPRPRAADVSLPVETTVVTSYRDIGLSRNMKLTLRVGHVDDWKVTSPSRSTPLWTAEIETPSATVAFAADAQSFTANATGPASLLVTPHAPSREVRAIAPPSALAVNYDSDSISSSIRESVPVTRIFPNDIARFTVGENGLELPQWSHPATSVESL